MARLVLSSLIRRNKSSIQASCRTRESANLSCTPTKCKYRWTLESASRLARALPLFHIRLISQYTPYTPTRPLSEQHFHLLLFFSIVSSVHTMPPLWSVKVGGCVFLLSWPSVERNRYGARLAVFQLLDVLPFELRPDHSASCTRACTKYDKICSQ